MKVRVKVKTLKEYLELRKKSVQLYLNNALVSFGEEQIKYDVSMILDLIEGIEKGDWEYEKELEPLSFHELIDAIREEKLVVAYKGKNPIGGSNLSKEDSLLEIENGNCVYDYYREEDLCQE